MQPRINPDTQGQSGTELPKPPREAEPSKPESAQDVREKIQALEMQKEAAMRNIQDMDAKIDEVRTGPNDPSMRDINLKLLNQYQEEKVRFEQRYKNLGMEIARKKVELQDLSN